MATQQKIEFVGLSQLAEKMQQEATKNDVAQEHLDVAKNQAGHMQALAGCVQNGGLNVNVPNAGPQYTVSAGNYSIQNLRAFADGVGQCLNGIGLLKSDGTPCTASDDPTANIFDGIPNASLQGLLDAVLDSSQWDA